MAAFIHSVAAVSLSWRSRLDARPRLQRSPSVWGPSPLLAGPPTEGRRIRPERDGDGDGGSSSLTGRTGPPPILIIGNFLSDGGGSRGVCEDLSTRLRAAGWTVHTTSDRRGVSLGFSRCYRRSGPAAASTPSLRWDVYSGPAFLWAAAAVELLFCLGKPIVLTLHGGNLPAYSKRHPKRIRRLLAKATVVTAPSEYLSRGLAAHRRNILRLSNPLEISAYPYSLRSQPRERLVWLRAFHEIYDPSLAVEVLARLVPTLPSVSLTMIGPDKHDGSLERVRAAALRLGVGDRLRIIPGVPSRR